MATRQRPATVGCAVLRGVDAVPVTIEATMHGTTGSPRILGQVDHVVREAYHRVLSAFAADGLEPPRGTPTINFVPANVRKTGSGFDLPMALALAGAAGLFPPARAHGVTALGEISLDGRILPAPGPVSVAIAAMESGRAEVLTCPESAAHAALVPGVRAIPVGRLRDALLWLRGEQRIEPAEAAVAASTPQALDLADIRGHETAKEALVTAAAGRHNLLLVGPPGSGKTALLRRIGGLLPAVSPDEALEILKIHTLQSLRPPPLGWRPIRAPHHSSSHVSLLGGGPDPRPGEVTLAHHGVLFLDELPEFRREALEGLRQPLESGQVVIGRAMRSATMPADFLLVAAMNPCPCGFHGHPSRACICTMAVRHRYQARVSGPLLDRFDLMVEVPALDPSVLSAPRSVHDGTERQRRRVQSAVSRQQARTGTPNGRLVDAALDAAVGRSRAVIDTLDEAIRRFHLSGRARVRLLRVARTLADLDERDAIQPRDVLLATRFRSLEAAWARS